ncbi:hypothetical protein DAPPUDRAFT_335516 [Daphnia pulex]|uniref:Uncharacterized protein n=1 Tax=Daphnia pulex TaxID=6669 RepID=E9HXY3_DAPPU|nr:hypothetical protein DAPPUDRAFT_335516 [Daphnia pulex]|eukprot:EFX63398.1 hypothetical protein DAPPUDRAFT_335516 [Daphnia pulex]
MYEQQKSQVRLARLRLKRLTSGLATTWEESESEKMLGVGKRKKIPSSKLQDAAALVVVKPRRGNPKKVKNTTTENEGNNQPSSSIVHRIDSGSPSVGRNNSPTGNAGSNLPNVPSMCPVHPTYRLWPPYAPNNTTTGNDGNNLPSVPIVHRGLWSPSVPTNSSTWIVTANLWSKTNNIPKQDVQDFIHRCKKIRKQDAYTHRGNTKQPVVLSERTIAPRQLKDDIQV